MDEQKKFTTREALQQQHAESRARTMERVLDGLTRFDEVTEKGIAWLWRERIPLGEVTTIEGDPEIGKSWLCFAIAAELSREGKNILYISNEDDAETVGKKRLRLLGADMTHIFSYSDKLTTGTSVKFVLPRGIAELSMLQGLVQATKADVIFINPLTGFLPPGTKMGKAEDMRPIFDCLAIFARLSRVSIIVIRHFGKSQENNVIGKGLGSIDIAGAARGMLYVTEHPDFTNDQLNEEYVRHRLVFQAKLNVDIKRVPLAFKLTKDNFEWFDTRPVSIHEATNPLFDVFTGTERSLIEEQVDALEAIFAANWPKKELELNYVKALIKNQNAGIRTLREACSRLGIKQSHEIEKGKGMKQWLKWEASTPPRKVR